MSYSGEIKKIGEWIKRETKIREVVYNKLPSQMSSSGLSCRIVFVGDENNPIKKDFRIITLVIRLSGDAESWADILDTLQLIQNNLLREREYDITFGEVENPDGSNVEGGDFMVELPINITVSTGKVAL